MALAADTVSIAVMELLDNAFIVAVPGAMDAGLTSALFWASLAASLPIAFVLTAPVNRWLISGARATPWCTSTTTPIDGQAVASGETFPCWRIRMAFPNGSRRPMSVP